MSFGNSEEWMVEIDKARPIVKHALDLGVNFVDTANVYSNGRSEEIVGELLQGHRDDVVIATKVRLKTGDGPNDEGLSRYHIQTQIRKSLKRLRTDRIDLYQIHRWDYSTPIEETLLTLNDLVLQGLVSYIGASSMFAWQFAKALYTGDLLHTARFVSMQNHYNLCYREEEREMIPLCNDHYATTSVLRFSRGVPSPEASLREDTSAGRSLVVLGIVPTNILQRDSSSQKTSTLSNGRKKSRRRRASPQPRSL
jgi:aryl-alcohol dehydrogenase (NADP+)